MRVWFVLLMLLVSVHAVGADPPARSPNPAAPAAKPAPPPTFEQAADAVLAAIKANDSAALKVLAAKDDPDPWFVADELIARGEFDAAEAFARAAPRKDVERLPAYVAAQRAAPTPQARRKSLDAAFAAIRGGDATAALAATEAAGPPSDDLVGARLPAARGIALRGLTRLEASAEAFRSGADVARRLGWLVGVAGGLEQSGLSSVQRSDFSAALRTWQEALAVEEERGDRRSIARVVGFLGNVHHARGDFLRSLEFMERSLRMQEEAGDDAGVATTSGNIGGAYYALGNFERALEFQQRALRLRERLGDPALVASTLANLGTVYASLGDRVKAFEYQERALAAAEALGDKSRSAKALASIGLLHGELEDWPRSLEFQQRALRLREEIGDRAGAAQALGNIGIGYANMGDIEKAREVLTDALARKEKLGDRWGAAATLGNLGNVLKRLGDRANALEQYERAHALFEELKDRAGAARALTSIGFLHLGAGDAAKALPVLERAAREAERIRAAPIAIAALEGVAEARLRTGDAGRALSDAKRGVALVEPLFGGLGEQEGALGRERFASLFDIGALASARVEDPAELAFFLESGRAGSLMESLGGRQALRWQALPEGMRREEAEARAAELVARAEYARAAEGTDLDAARAKSRALDAARARSSEVVERIQREAKKSASVFYPRAATLEEIEGWLAPEEALVLYGFALDEALALVIGRSDARIVALGKSADLAAACEALNVGDREADPADALLALRRRIVDPLSLPAGVTRVLVSPEGPLSYAPMSALLTGRDVACVPSGTTFGLLRDERDRRGDRVLALGDPDYGVPGDARSVAIYAGGRGGLLAPLPFTRVEVKAVGDVTLVGREASETGFRVALAQSKGRWRAVHLACHGLVEPERPTRSSLALTPDAENDGFLTALEVLRMEVPADLVVLSACETGKGKIVRGEGIVGLTRAFMFAGAPRVLCSLWKVDDEATRALMVKFYELWNPKDGKPGLPTAAALRKAQEFVRSQEKWKHPYYWAAWVLWGLPS